MDFASHRPELLPRSAGAFVALVYGWRAVFVPLVIVVRSQQGLVLAGQAAAFVGGAVAALLIALLTALGP